MEVQSIWKKAKEQKRFLAKKIAKITNAVPCKKICECKVWMILKELSIGNIIIALSQINKQKSKLPLVTKMIKKSRKYYNSIIYWWQWFCFQTTITNVKLWPKKCDRQQHLQVLWGLSFAFLSEFVNMSDTVSVLSC